MAHGAVTPASAPNRSVPRVRTLLVCDLADSTALVERLGDGAAADLLRRHDRMARDLLHKHGGREIDKTDGFLALFERPVEAVAFALAYQRALRALGDEQRQRLRARVGIHVGEVVLWENSASDVSGGAKPVDVEGLAKPVAARLMTLALPGQILLSGIAFSLAQRAAGELAGAGELRWLTHGRYRFKGVPAPMLVHEVGESGFSPLHAPPSGDKAERDIPLWRKPGVLTLEAILIASAIAIPFALSLRAPPAIAFGERDWVVVGDMRNLTGEPALDDSLETAFRISLEQSRYVNVLPDLKLRDSLARMQRPADTNVDRAVASEIALREGARAVILPTVAEVGGRVRVSAEVIDPQTQTTVYAESADGVGAESALESIDSVTHELRGRLGEALAAIDRDSDPLPQVTSGNIEALRAYSLAEAAYAEGRLAEARALYGEALRLDPEFALAMTGLARVDYREDDLASAKANATRAIALQDRLTARDRLYVAAWVATFGDPVTAVDKWKLLTDLYPDHLNGVYNLALYQWSLLSRAEACAETARRIDVSQYPYQPDAVYLRGTCLVMLDRLPEAIEQFERADKLGAGAGDAMRAAAHAAQGDFAAAEAFLPPPDDTPVPSSQAEVAILHAATLVDRGRHAEALAALARVDVPAGNALLRQNMQAVRVLTASLDGSTPAETAELRRALDESLALAEAETDEQLRPAAFTSLALGLAALRGGDGEMAARVLEAAGAWPSLERYPVHAALRDVLAAEGDSAAGRHDEALARLARIPPHVLLQAQAARVRVLEAAGRTADAEREKRELAAMRGRAYSEWGIRHLLRTLNVAEVARAAAKA